MVERYCGQQKEGGQRLINLFEGDDRTGMEGMIEQMKGWLNKREALARFNENKTAKEFFGSMWQESVELVESIYQGSDRQAVENEAADVVVFGLGGVIAHGEEMSNQQITLVAEVIKGMAVVVETDVSGLVGIVSAVINNKNTHNYPEGVFGIAEVESRADGDLRVATTIEQLRLLRGFYPQGELSDGMVELINGTASRLDGREIPDFIGGLVKACEAQSGYMVGGENGDNGGGVWGKRKRWILVEAENGGGGEKLWRGVLGGAEVVDLRLLLSGQVTFEELRAVWGDCLPEMLAEMKRGVGEGLELAGVSGTIIDELNVDRYSMVWEYRQVCDCLEKLSPTRE